MHCMYDVYVQMYTSQWAAFNALWRQQGMEGGKYENNFCKADDFFPFCVNAPNETVPTKLHCQILIFAYSYIYLYIYYMYVL